MTTEKFWQLIEHIDRDAMKQGEEEEAVEPLIKALSKLDEKEIMEFEENLAQALYEIDGKEFAENTGNSCRSGDGFLYCRCNAVAKGKKFYESVLKDPKKMPKGMNNWLEPLLFVSAEAWAIATGNNMEDWDYTPRVSYESGSNEKQW